MMFDAFVTEYCRIFKKQGLFELLAGQDVRARCIEERVPNEPGVYLIYERKDADRNLLYIGKAGTLQNNGQFKEQKLIGRLTNKQGRISRPIFYQKQISHLQLDALVFRWFVTFIGDVQVIPAKAEADLVQAYFDEHRRLPQWNKSL